MFLSLPLDLWLVPLTTMRWHSNKYKIKHTLSLSLDNFSLSFSILSARLIACSASIFQASQAVLACFHDSCHELRVTRVCFNSSLKLAISCLSAEGSYSKLKIFYSTKNHTHHCTRSSRWTKGLPWRRLSDYLCHCHPSWLTTTTTWSLWDRRHGRCWCQRGCGRG